jgi:hypothetical protein
MWRALSKLPIAGLCGEPIGGLCGMPIRSVSLRDIAGVNGTSRHLNGPI